MRPKFLRSRFAGSGRGSFRPKICLRSYSDFDLQALNAKESLNAASLAQWYVPSFNIEYLLFL